MTKTIPMRHVLFLAAIVLFGSCSLWKNKSTAGQNGLIKQQWVLTKIIDFEMEATRKPITLYFDPEEKRISGNAGCNMYGATYTLEKDNHVSFSPVISTKMACIPGIKTESAYLEGIRNTDSYEVSGDTLFLKKGETVLLEFHRNDGAPL